jgi:hypothetical protein
MYHYLEHTREPFGELDAAAKILPVGGYLLVELPNPESWFGRVLGRMWMPWFQPQHQHMIPVRNLVQALAVRGLSTVAVERGAAHRYGDLFTSLALALFAVSPDPRLPWLARRPTRWQWFRHRVVWTVARPPLVAAYGLDALIAVVVRRTDDGNAYRILARKGRVILLMPMWTRRQGHGKPDASRAASG